MGMDLIGPHRWFQWNITGWSTVLDIAMRHGWIPMGTGPCRGVRRKERDLEGYYSNDGHIVYARDARKLADALETFLAQTRSRHAVRRKNEAWFWSKPGRKVIRNFAVFCRKGSFRIY